jgi:hypothetical protein
LTPVKRQLAKHSLPKTPVVCPGSGMLIGDSEERRLHRAHRLRKARRAAISLISGGAAVLAYLAFFGLGRDVFLAAPVPSEWWPNPYNYLTTSADTPVHDLQCPGLLGLCVGQDVDLALHALGRDQVQGMPRESSPGRRCHAWEPRNARRVEICEEAEQIVSIDVQLTPESPGRLALPSARTVSLPMEFRDLSAELADHKQIVLADIYLYPEEGRWWYGMKWLLLNREGLPAAAIIARRVDDWSTVERDTSSKIPPCDLRAHLEGFGSATVQTISVREADVEEDRPCFGMN